MYPLYHHHVRHMKYTQSKQFYCLHWLCLLFHAKLTDYSPYLQILNQTLKSSSKLPTSHNLDSRPSIQHSTHVKTLTLFSFQFSTTPIMNIYWNQNCPWQTSSFGMKTPLSTPSMLLQWHIQFCMEQTMFTCQKPTKSTKMKISPKKRNLKVSMNFWKQVHIPCLCHLMSNLGQLSQKWNLKIFAHFLMKNFKLNSKLTIYHQPTNDMQPTFSINTRQFSAVMNMTLAKPKTLKWILKSMKLNLEFKNSFHFLKQLKFQLDKFLIKCSNLTSSENAMNHHYFVLISSSPRKKTNLKYVCYWMADSSTMQLFDSPPVLQLNLKFSTTSVAKSMSPLWIFHKLSFK